METNKENFKSLITNDIIQHINSFEPLQTTNEDILQKLTESIGQIDFMLLAFPESIEVKKQFEPFQNKLSNGLEFTEAEKKAIQ